MKLLICDLDGVVNAVSDVRAHLVPIYVDKSHYWSEWHKAHEYEPINPAVRSMLQAYVSLGFEICYMSSRQNTCSESTSRQLVGNGFPNGSLALRRPQDNTPPVEMKADTLGALLCYSKVEQLVIFDDDKNNLDAMVAEAAKFGVPCIPIHISKFIGCN